MAEVRIEPCGAWPAEDAPGRYVIRCSCRRWSATGTVAEINKASRGHDDSPFTHHVVSIRGRVIEDGDPGTVNGGH